MRAHIDQLWESQEQIYYVAATQRLLSHIDQRGPDECWPWTAGRFAGTGYGIHSVRGIPRGAHVASFNHFKGPIPDGLVVRHTCDNPPCCNPAHLLLGTYADNSQDCVDRGRCKEGEDHPYAKLTKRNVEEIRASYFGRNRGPTQYELAERFGVHQSIIWAVVHRRIWKSVA